MVRLHPAALQNSSTVPDSSSKTWTHSANAREIKPKKGITECYGRELMGIAAPSYNDNDSRFGYTIVVIYDLMVDCDYSPKNR